MMRLLFTLFFVGLFFISLSAKTKIAETEKKNIPASEIGTAFMRFAGKWDLKKIGDGAKSFMPMLQSKYRN